MRRRFQVAPMGNSVGLFFASGESQRLAVIVYPKFWQPEPVSRLVEWPEGASYLAIAAGELDVIELVGTPEQLSLVDRPVERIGLTGNPLLVPLQWTAAEKSKASSSGVAPVDALLGLESLMRRVALGSMLPVDHGFTAPHLSEPLLRPLLYRYFVDEVETVLRHARREYAWEEGALPVVRGRPDPVSLLIHSATGWPLVRCRYQDFTRATPTLKAVCAALSYIADDGISIHGEYQSLADPRDDAIRLRRVLADVPTVPRSVAVHTAIEARQAPSSGLWTKALNLAIGVLWPQAGLNLGDDESAVEISVDSSRIWELILQAVFRQAGLETFDGNRDEQLPLRVKRPWVGLGSRPPRPDLVVGDGDQWAVLDAKYKDVLGTPSIDDLYQMFAYSHLASDDEGGPVTSLGIVYPTRSDGAVGIAGPYLRDGDHAAELGVYYVRYPSLHDCRSDWKLFLTAQANLLGTAFHRTPQEHISVA